ncbi:hypothetical protein BCR33DRAFT_785111 [Rhizoclosmatium globosum]|uniref:Uncharacterized protein n=1 Tax=Rhizoclosmatium globosum TaxID=329046 RepID=A0A1Y2CC25_9FUNG|nr:hypothetical protein HDU99_002098 [Rhizoclosmatium hyalinum]ORY44437.1 hypothetical protein BCR33DRAFT_785111 [Rhizoclosmatium globosum]|eukprot:ORY44437.1 hypothetical protein BCR33DRAFT_785111 [Rhizoclosmatium globosum]
MKTQKEFLEWTKANLGFSKSTTYEYIISYRVYMEIANKIPEGFHPPLYQSHCQLLSKVPQKKLLDTWLDVCRQAPSGVITTAFLESYLDKNNLKSKTGRVTAQSSETVEDEPINEEDHNGAGGSSSGSHRDSGGNGTFLSASQQSNSSSSSANVTASFNNTLPFNEHLIYELSKQVVLGNQFDQVLQSVEDYQAAENRMWAGRIWANLASVRPLTTKEIYSVPPAVGDAAVFEGGLEHLLRIIFTKFAAKEFAEGLFLLRAEFGADWFSPILQHPYCILRHTNPPAPIEIPINPNPVPNNDTASSAAAGKRTKRGSTVPSIADEAKSTPMTACVQPPFESFVMFYLGPNVKDFCNVFRSVALVPGVNSWSAVVGAPAVALSVGNAAQ